MVQRCGRHTLPRKPARTLLSGYTALPYSKRIAEIVSLSGYESQVSALLNEPDRTAMEFFIASAPEDHPVIPGAGGFRQAPGARRGEGKSGGLRVDVKRFASTRGRCRNGNKAAENRTQPPARTLR